MDASTDRPAVAVARRAGRARGFTFFELLVAGAVVAVLVGMLLLRLDAYEDDARGVKMRAMVAELRTALRMRTVETYLHGGHVDSDRLAQENPIDWLRERPPNYRGAFYSPNLAELGGDSWFYDRKSKRIAYVLRKGKIFNGYGLKAIYFNVELCCLPVIPARPSDTPAQRQVVVLNQVEE